MQSRLHGKNYKNVVDTLLTFFTLAVSSSRSGALRVLGLRVRLTS
jgi:hypothetical protein